MAKAAPKQVRNDEPSELVQALLANQNLIVAAIQAICAKIDGSAGTIGTDYESAVSDALQQITKFN